MSLDGLKGSLVAITLRQATNNIGQIGGIVETTFADSLVTRATTSGRKFVIPIENVAYIEIVDDGQPKVEGDNPEQLLRLKEEREAKMFPTDQPLGFTGQLKPPTIGKVGMGAVASPSDAILSGMRKETEHGVAHQMLMDV